MRALIDIFKDNISENDVVRELITEAGNCFWGEYNCQSDAVLSGYFTYENYFWPTSLEEYDLAVEWMDWHGFTYGRFEPERKRGRFNWIADESEEDANAFKKVRKAEALLKSSFDAMLLPLKRGTIKAHGHFVTGGSVLANISEAFWKRPSTRIDFINGEIWRVVHVEVTTPPGWDPRTALRKERLEREWTGLMVDVPVPAAETPILEADGGTEEKSRHKVGRVPFYPWEQAFTYLLIDCKQNGFPNTGAELVRRMVNCLKKAGLREPNDESIKTYLYQKHNALWKSCIRKKGPGQDIPASKGR